MREESQGTVDRFFPTCPFVFFVFFVVKKAFQNLQTAISAKILCAPAQSEARKKQGRASFEQFIGVFMNHA